MLDRVLARIEAGFNTAVRTGSPLAQLDSWIDAVICTLSEDPPAGRLLMRALVDEEPFPSIAVGPGGAGLDREMMAFEERLAGILERMSALIAAGIEAGDFRPVPIGDTLLCVIGAVTFHFASGELGEALLGDSLFSADAVERRRREVARFIRGGLIAP